MVLPEHWDFLAKAWLESGDFLISQIGTKLSLGRICGGPVVAASNSSSVYVKCGKVLQISKSQKQNV